VSSRSTSSLFLRFGRAHSGATNFMPSRGLPLFQFWNGHEIPRGVFYLFPSLPGLKGTRPPLAFSTRGQRIVFLTASRYCTSKHRGGSLLFLSLSLSLSRLSLCLPPKFPRYPTFMSRTLKRNMNGLRAPVSYTLGGK